MNRSSKLRLLLPLAAVGSLVLAACGDDDDTADDTSVTTGAAASPDTTGGSDGTAGGGSGEITVGSADFPESQLLAEIYGQSLAAAGFEVSYQPAIGAREIYYDAIAEGEIDLIPEYTGSLLAELVKRHDLGDLEATTVEDQVALLKEHLDEGLTVLDPSTAEDKDVISCTSAAAEEFGLAKLSDLEKASGEIKIGAQPEFAERNPFGLVGFKELYNFEPGEFVPLTVSAAADSLKSGAIDCGNLFSTMSVITTAGFVTLEDTDSVVPHEAVLPLIRDDVVDDTVTSTLGGVNADLDTDVLKELMVKVEVDKQGPDVVAKEWLASR